MKSATRFLFILINVVLAIGAVAGVAVLFNSPHTGIGIREKNGVFLVKCDKNGRDTALVNLNGRRVLSISGWRLSHCNLNHDPDGIEKFDELRANIRARKYLSDSLKTHGSLELVFADSTRYRIAGRPYSFRKALVAFGPWLLFGIILAMAGFAVAAKRSLNAPVRIYLALTICVLTVFYTCSFLLQYAYNIGMPFSIQALALAINLPAFTFVPVFFLHLFLIFPTPFKFVTNKRFIAGYYLVAGALFVLYETRLFYPGQTVLYGVGFLGAITAAAFRIFDRSMAETERAQLRWIGLGAIGFVFVFVLFYLIPILSGNQVYNGYLYGAFAFLLIPVSFSFAILRYRLNDVDLIFDTAVVHGITIAALTILDVTVSMILFDFIHEKVTGTFMVFLVNAWIILALYRPIRTFLGRVIRKTLQRDRYQTEEAVYELSGKLLNSADSADALRATVSVISKCLNPRIIEVYPPGFLTEVDFSFLTDDSIERLLTCTTVQREYLPQTDMQYVFVPLFKCGILCAKKKSGTLFNKQDMLLLSVIRQQATIALSGIHEKGVAIKHKHELVKTRERIAREIHDSVGGNLSVASMILDQFENRPESAGNNSPDKIDQLRDLIRISLFDIRDLIWINTRNAESIEDLGDYLIDRIRKQCSSLGIEVHFETRGLSAEVIIGNSMRLHLLRVILEAVTNSIKHAEATKIHLSFEVEHDRFVVVVKDNGKGFPVNTKKTGHHGIANMHSRIAEIGGTLNIESAAGCGTSVEFAVPVPEAGVPLPG
jgi:signal transduction histidine kinase